MAKLETLKSRPYGTTRMFWNPTQPCGDMEELERIELALPYGRSRALSSLALPCHGARML